MSLDISLDIPACSHCGRGAEESRSCNETHNLVPMWREAGCFDALYESQGKLASTLLPELRAGLARMEASPEDFKKLNPSNGWGNYETAVSFLKEVIDMCERAPRFATIRVWA